MAIAGTDAELIARLWVFIPNSRANTAQLFNQPCLFALAGREQAQHPACELGLEHPAPCQPDVALALVANQAGPHVRTVLLWLALVPFHDGGGRGVLRLGQCSHDQPQGFLVAGAAAAGFAAGAAFGAGALVLT